MKSYIIVVDSYTAARRGANYLNSIHIRAFVEKVGSASRGCGFGIKVSADPAMVCRKLLRLGIQCREVIERER